MEIIGGHTAATGQDMIITIDILLATALTTAIDRKSVDRTIVSIMHSIVLDLSEEAVEADPLADVKSTILGKDFHTYSIKSLTRTIPLLFFHDLRENYFYSSPNLLSVNDHA